MTVSIWCRRPFSYTGADGEVIVGPQRVHAVPAEVARHAVYRNLALPADDRQAVREREMWEAHRAHHGNGPPAVVADDCFPLGKI